MRPEVAQDGAHGEAAAAVDGIAVGLADQVPRASA